jgi:serine/threonine protein kinase
MTIPVGCPNGMDRFRGKNMAISLRSDADGRPAVGPGSVAPPAALEPIAGYKLLKRIGRGAFGEVWKAEAPGGVLKAVKLVHGTLRSGIGDEALILQELKSLDAVKKVRHPYILSLDRYDLIDGQLVIIMELADCSLWDRYQSCLVRGRGIPRNELLAYLAEAAEALDVMNLRYRLQHSDIKPQNLFLVHHHIKVADFGLVKDLERLQAPGNCCFSPLYAAPELFAGAASSTADQYSLAIVYQELLTGRRPFDGKSPRQLLLQHMQQPPDVSPLPTGDQPAILRALAKNPGQRFASCGDLVQALRRASPERTTNVQASGSVPESVSMEADQANPGEQSEAMPDLREAHAAASAYARRQRSFCQVCPGCGYTGRLPHRFSGLRIRCRACQRTFVAGFSLCGAIHYRSGRVANSHA